MLLNELVPNAIPQRPQVVITYCSNYNGCHIAINGEYIDYEDPRVKPVHDAVVDFAFNECNEDGEFYGNIEDVEQVALTAAKKHFGPNVDVTFEEDSSST